MYNEFIEGIDSVRFSNFDEDERLEKQKKFVNPLFEKLLKLHFIKNKEPNRFKKVLKEATIREEFVLDPKDMGAFYFEKVKDGV
jgi:hypothetical protein